MRRNKPKLLIFIMKKYKNWTSPNISNQQSLKTVLHVIKVDIAEEDMRRGFTYL